MNPSANGWIKKLVKNLSKDTFESITLIEFYDQLKATGFIYGSNIDVVSTLDKINEFSEEERCKINLLLSFYFIYSKENPETDFIESVVAFYKKISAHKRSILSDLFGETRSDILLEQIIHKRIHIDDNFITKNFNYFLINALLFVDVLGYIHYLKPNSNPKTYIWNFEAALETIVFTVLESKLNKSKYDNNLIKLFEASLRHKTDQKPDYTKAISLINTTLEKQYIIDTVCMASWSNTYIDREEYMYLNQLKIDLDVKAETLIKSIDTINSFYAINKGDISFLSSKNLAQSFYDNSSGIVSRLIKRNSKRLLKELNQSKEAMVLLTQSTTRNLTDEEQKKIQNQLLDIFKSIPSLAIFMLPGGMLLMPLFVKFIPKLLPSAFDDNRIEEG